MRTVMGCLIMMIDGLRIDEEDGDYDNGLSVNNKLRITEQ